MSQVNYSQMKRLIIYADGGARGNPGPAGAGSVVMDEKEKVLAEVSRFLGHTTNNVAEYTALIEGLKAARKVMGTKKLPLEIRMDSELAIRQLQGRYKVRHPNLKPLFGEATSFIEKHFPDITFTHVRREKNTLADALANKAMDEGTDSGR